MSHIIALTGGICSGKSTVTKIFSKFPDISIVDADVISKEVTQPHTPAILSIIKYFGTEILSPNGSLNRNKLKRRIFFNPNDKKWLEELLHPIIQQETQKKIHSLIHRSPYIIWVVPLLIENNLQKLADRILVVDVYPKIQLNRIVKRDKINELYAKNILLSQSSRKNRLNHANDIINNNYSIQNTASQVLTMHQLYLKINKYKY